MGLTHLGCPSCGGTLSLTEGQRLVTCPYCGGKSLALIPGVVPRYVVSQAVSREDARRTAQRLLTGPMLPRALRKHGRIQDASLCYVPFYEFTGTRLGTFLLREREKPSPVHTEDGSEEAELWLLPPAFPVEREDTRVIQQDYLQIGPGCELPELGLNRIPLESLRRGGTPAPLESFDLVALESRAVVFAPTKAPQDFAEECQQRIKVRGDRTALVEQRLKVLYYPVWQARYLYRGRPYEIAVDGVTGKLLFGRAPASMRLAAALVLGALALAALCFGRPARQLFVSGFAIGGPTGWTFGMLGGSLALLAGGAMVFLIARIALSGFRQLGEMVLDKDQGGFRLDLGSDAGGVPRALAALSRPFTTGRGPPSPRPSPPTGGEEG